VGGRDNGEAGEREEDLREGEVWKGKGGEVGREEGNEGLGKGGE